MNTNRNLRRQPENQTRQRQLNIVSSRPHDIICQAKKHWLSGAFQKTDRPQLIIKTVNPIPAAYGETITTPEDELGNSEIIGYKVFCPFCKKFEEQITGTAAEGYVLQSLCGRGFYRIFMDDVRRDIVHKVLEAADYEELL
jgi:hypothetical protein